MKNGIDTDTTESMLDKFWSLQYMIPAGVLNGFAGPVEVMHAADSRLCMTHAVHFRFGSMQVGLCTAFLLILLGFIRGRT